MKFLSRLLSITVIAFADGRCREVKGKVSGNQLRDVANCLTEAGVARSEIWIGGDGRIQFSPEIAPALHQRLRNILTQF